MSRDSQRCRVPLIFQEWVKLRMWNLLIKQEVSRTGPYATEVLNMRSLTNKTANIKYKNLSVYKTV